MDRNGYRDNKGKGKFSWGWKKRQGKGEEWKSNHKMRNLHIIGFIHSIPVLNILIMNLISKTEFMVIHVAIILSSNDRDSFTATRRSWRKFRIMMRWGLGDDEGFSQTI